MERKMDRTPRGKKRERTLNLSSIMYRHCEKRERKKQERKKKSNIIRLQYYCLHTIFQKLNFSKSHFLKHRKKNMTMSFFFCNPEVLKSAAKNLKISSRIKYLCPKIISNRSFACARR